MLRLAVLACFAVLASAAGPCCTPKQWHGTESMVIGSMANGKAAQGYLTKASYMVNFDADSRRVALIGTSETNGYASNVKVLIDYNRNVQYTVSNGTCTKQIPNADPGSCVPANATVSGHGFLGVGSSAVNVTQYSFMIDRSTAYLTVTDNCIPVAETYYGVTNGTYAFTTIAFTGIKGGLSGNTVFNLPTECALGTGTINGGFAVGRRSYFA
ncbi:uncharacterized protein LOC110445539 [Mizuhopecten yessoensis]|uniref:Ependymin-related protein 1 n=1 Tax=Mizuhopecten yessoensis TaxID=6573 RepID=A0A210QZ31_MIZYE|nr:uncharacterized protein LOC110445539 [Mizuhopecten yessoensis]OWF54019.1 Ependymin-related protein 1 [Mizuhopecten yessoensis]